MAGVKGRSGSGGRRSGSGRLRKIYKPIILDYKPDSPKNVIRSLIDLYNSLLEDKIERGKAATAAHILEIIAKILISSGTTVQSQEEEMPLDEYEEIREAMLKRGEKIRKPDS